MLNKSTSSSAYLPHRRTADNTPASRVVNCQHYSPTSPKIHELREKYLSQQVKKDLK